MRRRTGARARAMLDVSTWCSTPGCVQPPAHISACTPSTAAVPGDPATIAAQLAAVVAGLTRTRFRYVDEIELHAGIAAMLNEIGVPTGPEHREVVLSPRDRIDFLLASGIGIEVKVAGRPGDVWRQLRRYAESDRVRALLLITTRARHVTGVPTSLNDKTMAFHVLRGGLR